MTKEYIRLKKVGYHWNRTMNGECVALNHWLVSFL